MNVFCLEDFKIEIEKLKSKKPYYDIEKDIIDYFLNKSLNELKSGIRLNNSDQTPYIKKRIGGSGGYRFYYLLLIKNENLYLMFVHPKTGPLGTSNISEEYKALIYKKVLLSITNNTLYKVTSTIQGNHLLFEKLIPVKI